MKDLQYIVNSTQIDTGEMSNAEFARRLKWAIDGYRKLNMHGLAPSIKSTFLDVDKNTNTVELPADYQAYTKIGICVNGYIINFDYNREICLAEKDALCACDSATIQNTLNTISGGFNVAGVEQWHYQDFRYNNLNHTAGLYAVGGGFYGGGYRIDEQNQRICFDSYVSADKVLLEYQSSGIDDNGNALIDDNMVPCLLAFVHWKRCQFSSDRLMAMYKNEWEQEAVALTAIRNGMTGDEFVGLIRQYIHQSIKR